jgi:hypothetical protein
VCERRGGRACSRGTAAGQQLQHITSSIGQAGLGGLSDPGDWVAVQVQRLRLLQQFQQQASARGPWPPPPALPARGARHINRWTPAPWLL